MPDNKGKKVVILGGGCGAMAAAFWLTDDPAWRQTFESVTVYQQGWRLGGKGAAGRGMRNRIEEHGLHLWGGFYPNAFHMIRRCYEQLGRPATHPLATWDKAFEAANGFCAEELVDGVWKPWLADLPAHDGDPGDIDPATGQPYGPPEIPWMMSQSAGWLSDRIDEFDLPPDLAADKKGVVDALRAFSAKLLDQAGTLAVSAVDFMPRNEWSDETLGLRQKTLDLLDGSHSLTDDLRHLRIIAELVLTCMAGILDDGVIHGGFDAIDDEHLGDWLERHGASASVTGSAIVEGGYDYVFAYLGGDVSRPSLSAGVALRGFIRLVFGYRGALFWKMHHGMGDAVFTPLYELLQARGVQFNFFHCVRKLSLSTDKRRIATISLGRQATLKPAPKSAKTPNYYDPLVRQEDGLASWPAMPLLDQLEDGGVVSGHWSTGDLEAGAAADPGTDVVTLQDVDDFDVVVLGLPVAELRTVCAELGQKLPAWQAMLEMPTVPTLSCQLWLQKALTPSRWKPNGVDIVTNFVQPFNTLANMSHLVNDEQTGAKAVVYLCGPLDQSQVGPGTPQATANGLVRDTVRAWLGKNVKPVMPTFKEADLVDFGDFVSDRFGLQYFRANISPSEQYVLSVPGTAKVRLPSDGSGVDNLLLAGDWTRNGWNAGCVEAAVVSGLRAARAILGDPRPIPGEHD
jgi:uncharacterized protein with NAD-binding domain and iron-sulfur cluster